MVVRIKLFANGTLVFRVLFFVSLPHSIQVHSFRTLRSLRLVRKPTGKPVEGAVIFRT
jgi:hypothetical protein